MSRTETDRLSRHGHIRTVRKWPHPTELKVLTNGEFSARPCPAWTTDMGSAADKATLPDQAIRIGTFAARSLELDGP